MSEKVYILLPVHNRREITRRFIRCLNQQTYHNYHLVLIDDGSTDGTTDMVRAQITSLTVITGNGNWWWGGSLHEGYRWLRTRNLHPDDVILIINDDTEFDQDFLKLAMKVLVRNARSFLLAESYNRETGQWIDGGVYVDWKHFSFERSSAEKPANCFSTRALFSRAGDFFVVGGFHPRLLPHYLSDYEFTVRARRKGINLMTDSSVTVLLDPSTTGYNRIEERSFLGGLKKVFSRRSAINPLTLFVFVALACPWQWKFHSWLRIFSLSVSNGLKLLSGKVDV